MEFLHVASLDFLIVGFLSFFGFLDISISEFLGFLISRFLDVRSSGYLDSEFQDIGIPKISWFRDFLFSDFFISEFILLQSPGSFQSLPQCDPGRIIESNWIYFSFSLFDNIPQVNSRSLQGLPISGNQ